MSSARGAVLIVTLAVLVLPLAASGQPRTGMARIGVLESISPAAFPERLEALRRGLADLGYVAGQTVAFEYRWAHGNISDLPRLAAELVHLKVDIIVAGTTPAALAAKRATDTMPIVFAVPADPVGVGLVPRLARPGDNVTGLTTANIEIVPKRLELLRDVLGGKMSRGAVLFNPSDASNVLVVRGAEDAGKRLGISVRAVPVKSPDEFERAFSAIAADRMEGVIVAAGALTDSHAGRLAGLAARARVPAIYGARGFVEAGGLMSYSASFADNYRRAATYVDKILRGARPGDLPVEQASTFELAINLRTARALGVSIPASVLLRADLVVE